MTNGSVTQPDGADTSAANLVSIAEASARLRVSPKTLRAWWSVKHIGPARLLLGSRAWYLDKGPDSIEEFINRAREEGRNDDFGIGANNDS